MATEIPEEAKELQALVSGEFEKLILSYEEKKLDGLSIKEVFEMLTKVIASLVRLIEHLGGAHPGNWKKVIVSAALEDFYVRIIKPMDISGIPNWLEWSIVDPLLERSIGPIVSAIIDALVAIFNSVGWGLNEDVTVLPEPIE